MRHQALGMLEWSVWSKRHCHWYWHSIYLLNGLYLILYFCSKVNHSIIHSLLNHHENQFKQLFFVMVMLNHQVNLSTMEMFHNYYWHHNTNSPFLKYIIFITSCAKSFISRHFQNDPPIYSITRMINACLSYYLNNKYWKN
jgi:hypothetical protein